MRNKVTCYLDTLHEYGLLLLVHLNTRKKWSIHGLHLYLRISLGFSINPEYPKLIKKKKRAMDRCDLWFFMARHQTCYNHCLHELERAGQFAIYFICFFTLCFFVYWSYLAATWIFQASKARKRIVAGTSSFGNGIVWRLFLGSPQRWIYRFTNQ